MSQEVVDAIRDLTKVVLATSGKGGTKAEAVRMLDELSIPGGRIALILAIPSKDVSSYLARAKKQKGTGRGNANGK